MARLRDVIEDLINQMIDLNNGFVELTRGELAERVNCVPSQITYVLSTRFTNGQGYLVESRRGGGGWIRIRRIGYEDSDTSYVMHVLNAIGESLSQHQAEIYLKNFVDYKVISKPVAAVMKAGLSDQALNRVDGALRDQLRMDIMKNMLMRFVLGSGPEQKHNETSSENKKGATADEM